LLANPEFWLLAPIGPKQLEFALNVPLEALWLRPKRIAAAEANNAQVVERLVQSGLDLVRDVQVACADVRLAQERWQIAQDLAQVRERTAALAAARLRAGDATPLEEATARLDALRAREDASRLVYDLASAEERLRNLLGLGRADVPVRLAAPAELPAAPADAAALLDEALANRPSALAAALGVEAAERRIRVARCDYVLFGGIVDANDRGDRGFEVGPGFRVILPLFNWNQGAIARAEAERDRAVLQQRTVHDRVVLEVREAHLRWRQAREDLDVWQARIRPVAETAIQNAEKAYQEGEAALVLVLDTTRQLLDARLREAQLRADLRRAHAELERSVGRRLDGGGPPP
jgi:cobalt-zinc-cadmium efflux system outer membrane protein